MKNHRLHILVCAVMASSYLILLPARAVGQRMPHQTPQARPTTSTPKAKPASGGQINGGAVKATPRPAPSATPSATPSARPAQSRPSAADKTNIDNRANAGNRDVNINSGNRDVNINVDNSKDIDINVERNTVVRRSPYHYARPPYSYGGRHYYCHHHYHYHPYRPFYWGPAWHPWGFFIATLAVTAIIVSVNNTTYHYDQGVFYSPSNGGYVVVTAPVGATVTTIPPSSQPVVINETVTNNYYYGGTYYEKSGESYTVVAPTAGSIVENLPEGAEEVRVGEVTYVKFGETYYQPIQVDGKDMYEVVQVD